MAIYPPRKDGTESVRVSRGYFTDKEAELSSLLHKAEQDERRRAKGHYQF